jgi:hypothetical protein
MKPGNASDISGTNATNGASDMSGTAIVISFDKPIASVKSKNAPNFSGRFHLRVQQLLDFVSE